MKKALISSFLIGTLIISTSIICTASTYDFPNMTSEELNEVKDIIDDELHINHTPNKNEISEVEKVTRKAVEHIYGSENVDWAWFDYNYTKDWNFYTMKTYAGITTQDSKDAKYEIYSEVLESKGIYEIVYLKVGDNEEYNNIEKAVTDERILRILKKEGRTGVRTEKDQSHKKVKTDIPVAEEVLTVSAASLYEEFDNNKIAAKSKYKGKRILVSGSIHSIDENMWGELLVRLRAAERGLKTVTCYFSKNDKDIIMKLTPGQMVTIKGTCGDKVMLDVSVNDCYLIE